jgi:methyl-accepting chemotaxis protein
MAMWLPGPGTVFSAARSTVGWVVESATAASAVPARVLGLVEGTEALLRRINSVVDRAESLLDRADGAVGDAEESIERVRALTAVAAETVAEAARISSAAGTLVAGAGRISDDAGAVVDQAKQAAGTVQDLLSQYEATARRAAPLAEHFVEELSPDEVDAAIKLVDQLPRLTEHVLSDVLPILATLDRVGPEIHELLQVTRDVRQAILGFPGFGFFRRRGEGRLAGGQLAEERDDDGSSPARA